MKRILEIIAVPFVAGIRALCSLLLFRFLFAILPFPSLERFPCRVFIIDRLKEISTYVPLKKADSIWVVGILENTHNLWEMVMQRGNIFPLTSICRHDNF